MIPSRGSRVGVSLVIAEFDQESLRVEDLHDRADLPNAEIMFRTIREQRHGVEERRSTGPLALLSAH